LYSSARCWAVSGARAAQLCAHSNRHANTRTHIYQPASTQPITRTYERHPDIHPLTHPPTHPSTDHHTFTTTTHRLPITTSIHARSRTFAHGHADAHFAHNRLLIAKREQPNAERLRSDHHRTQAHLHLHGPILHLGLVARRGQRAAAHRLGASIGPSGPLRRPSRTTVSPDCMRCSHALRCALSSCCVCVHDWAEPRKAEVACGENTRHCGVCRSRTRFWQSLPLAGLITFFWYASFCSCCCFAK
jgi:hypothetical protein